MEIEKLQEIIDKSSNIVFFGGAGVSTASGIPDFRSDTGLYSETHTYSPEVILSRTFYTNNKEEFFEFYRDKMLFLDARPNAAHTKLTELEKSGKLKAIITQNIDGLHQKSGSEKVLELHGSVLRNYCEECGLFHDVEIVLNSTGIPKCTECGADVKPDVVLYEELLDHNTIGQSTKAVIEADLLIVGGTSLTVYPAAGFIDLFKGENLVIINKSATLKDESASLTINADIAEVFDRIRA